MSATLHVLPARPVRAHVRRRMVPANFIVITEQLRREVAARKAAARIEAILSAMDRCMERIVERDVGAVR